MTATLNLTQHLATQEQQEAGVIDLPTAERQRLHALLTFDETPSANDITERADQIAELAALHTPAPGWAMIGGAPFLMRALEAALAQHGISPCYAFSCRETVETRQPDGGITKTSVFHHLGFVMP